MAEPVAADPTSGGTAPRRADPPRSSSTLRCGCSGSAATHRRRCGRSPRRPASRSGNAYYYFGSKEHLVQEFYDSARGRAPSSASADLLDRSRRSPTGCAARCTRASTWPARTTRSRATFFKTAAEPTSPLCPFSAESAPAREASIALFREVLDGSTRRWTRSCAPSCPSCSGSRTWAPILYWVHDTSAGPGAQRCVDRAGRAAGRPARRAQSAARAAPGDPPARRPLARDLGSLGRTGRWLSLSAAS